MNEIEVRDDHQINYFEIQDGEAIVLQLQTPEGITDEILIIRPLALELAKIIRQMMKK